MLYCIALRAETCTKRNAIQHHASGQLTARGTTPFQHHTSSQLRGGCSAQAPSSQLTGDQVSAHEMHTRQPDTHYTLSPSNHSTVATIAGRRKPEPRQQWNELGKFIPFTLTD